MNLQHIQVISFDAFGTVVTMKPTYWMGEVIRSLPDDVQRSAADVERSHRRLVCENRKIVEELLHQGLILGEQVKKIQYLIDEEVASIQLIPGAKELIARLSKKYKIAITSNLGYDYGKKVLEVLDQPIDYKVFSYENGSRKPEIEIFKQLINISNVEPYKILHIGDKYMNDYQGALSAGLSAIHIDVKNENKADHCTSSIEELAKILK
jgi:FMN phosphatase YigB (HAD superfamily)